MRRADLTERQVAKLAKTPGCHWVSRNLYLDTTSGASWTYRYMIDGAARAMGLGAYGDYTLAEARERARQARRLANEAVDPIEERRERRAAARLERAKVMTFREAAERYIAARRASWGNPRHAKQWPTTLEAYVYPAFGKLPVQAIDVGLVMKVLEPIWQGKPETASRVRGRIEAVLDWATARGYRKGENPARWRGHLESLLPKKNKVRAVKHLAALPYGELADFMFALRQQEGIAARALEFLVLTAGRPGEVIGARWDEVNLSERVRVVPARRMKGAREHTIPLSDAALAILEQMQPLREGDFVFPGRTGGGIGHSSLLKLLARMGRGELTAHGFRSTFADWVTEKTDFPAEARELALAHKVGGAVVEAYRRGNLFEKRRALMAAWSRFCAEPVPTGTVVQFPAAG